MQNKTNVKVRGNKSSGYIAIICIYVAQTVKYGHGFDFQEMLKE